MESSPRIRYMVVTVMIIAGVALVFVAVPRIWQAMQIFILAMLLVLALEIPVQWQVARGVPRWAAVVNLLLLVLVALILVVAFLVPPLVEQVRQFTHSLPTLWAQAAMQAEQILHQFPSVEQALELDTFVSNLVKGAGTWAQTARSLFATAVETITSTILIAVTVFYSLLNPWPLLYGVRGLFPTGWWLTLDRLAVAIAGRIRAWVAGTLVLAVIIAVLDFIALSLINYFIHPGLPFVLFFAILGGALEVLPIVGPLIAAALPTLSGFAISPLLGLLVLGTFFLIQLLENNLIAPLVMQRVLKLHPVSLLVTLVMLTGVFGIFGAIIAVPVASIIKVLYDEWYYPHLHDGARPLPAPRPARER